MQLNDITVLVRDKDYVTQGMIRPEDLDMEASVEHNNVGSWQLTLPADHPLTATLRTPGAGIIVQGPVDIIFSGPTVKPELAITPLDPGGTVTFEGVTDNVILADALAYPDPANDIPTGQTKETDRRTGPSETLMHAYVNANIGPSAVSTRRKTALLMGTNSGRGTTLTKFPAFQVLGELLTELSIEATYGLGFRVVQRGSNLKFETYQVANKTAEIRLDTINGTLAGQRVATSPPGLTYAVVAGKGIGKDRQLVEVTTPASVAAQAQWGRRIERFVDKRDTDKWPELTAAGTELLNADGFSSVAIQAVPADDTAMTFGIDWYLGDRVTVVVEGQEITADVTGFVFKANSDGFKVGAVIGDPKGFSSDGALGMRVANTEARISAIERTTPIAQVTPYTSRATINIAASSTGVVPTGAWTKVRFMQDRGSSVAGDGFNWIGHDTALNAGEFYLDVPGRYLVVASVSWATNGTGQRGLQCYSSVKGLVAYDAPPATTVYCRCLNSFVINSVDGETLWFNVYQSSGAGLGFVGGDAHQNVSINYLGPL